MELLEISNRPQKTLQYISGRATVEWPNWRPLAALDVNENEANWLTANRKTI